MFDHDDGGVLLAVKGSIKTHPFNFTSMSLELAGVVINSLSKKMLVCVCYRPPNGGNEFHEEFDRFLKCVNDSRCKDVIILGDFNFPSVEWLNGSGFSDLRAECGFTEVLQEAGFFQLINAPTRGHNLIDLLLTTNEYLISNFTVTDDDSVCLKSDHKAITADINVNMKVKKQAKRTVYNYAKCDFKSPRATLRCLKLLEIIDSEHDVDTAWAK